MSTVTTIPALEQSCALGELVRRGELTREHRALLAELLDQIASSARVAGQAAERYPGQPEFQAIFEASVWRQAGTEYVRVLDAAAAVTAACLWCGIGPVPHVVLGDPLCERLLPRPSRRGGHGRLSSRHSAHSGPAGVDLLAGPLAVRRGAVGGRFR
ncbi:MAG: hypothetical protein ACT4NY_32385 [Pseudonocardiales bacterium]